MFSVDLGKMEIIESSKLSHDILGYSVGENGDTIAYTAGSKIIVSKPLV